MNNIKILRNIVKRDLLYGFSKNKVKYIIFALLIVLITVGMCNSIKSNEGNIVDLFFLNYRGIGYLDNIKELNALPIIWITINVFVAFIVGDFVSEDLKRNSIYVITRTKRFKEYWVSKVYWVVINVFFIYLILFTTTYFIGGLLIEDSIVWSKLSNDLIKSILVKDVVARNFIIALIILYFTTSLAISFLQIYLTMFTKSNISYLIIVIVTCFSIFIDNQLLPGIHSMILKHDYFDNIHNLTLLKSILYNISLTLMFSYLGYRKITKKDII